MVSFRRREHIAVVQIYSSRTVLLRPRDNLLRVFFGWVCPKRHQQWWGRDPTQMPRATIFFDAQQSASKPGKISEDRTGSCGRVHVLRDCRGAVPVDISLIFQSGWCRGLPLFVPDCGQIVQGEAVRWFFQRSFRLFQTMNT